ncbi:Mut7-C RNAse domain-containing protein [Pontibacter beigongshangensis]|uniref:Mut7-C RNAse domain-containing protein n=1 Tax=Pontibacter beigongshangensis TaxID=2574733 RepID=UPI00293B99B6|nr:Mut7-C RNAse domain-containing protein [Pontibacter beigongshangensis]
MKVYPANTSTQWPENYSLQAGLPVSDKFILDVHVGRLARALRLLGFDSRYQNDYADTSIAQLALKENRIVLTRDIGLLKHRSIHRGYWLRSQHLQEQLAEVIAYFRLGPRFETFSRCLACKGQIVPVPKAEVVDQLPPKTRRYFNEFYRCPSCRRVYWKGSHYERMQEFLQRLGQQE